MLLVITYSSAVVTTPLAMTYGELRRLLKSIRTAHDKIREEFEARFGISARTMEGWEEGRKLDVSARILMAMIERDPQAVEANFERLKVE
jgi:DNA-binding transcriptional regulator YiaG